MSRDYKNVSRKKPEPLSKRFGNTLSFLTGLSVGLFVAVIIYFHEHNASIKTNNTLLTAEQASPEPTVESREPEKADLPEQKSTRYYPKRKSIYRNGNPWTKKTQ